MTDSIDAALAHERAGRVMEAQAEYAALLKQNPSHVEANHRLGLLALAAGRAETAIALILRAAKEAPQRWDIVNNLGNALLKNGWSAEAVEAYRRALELKPGDGDLILNLAQGLFSLGNARSKAGHAEEAEIHLSEAWTLAPDRAAIAVSLGSVLLDRGRTEQALTTLDQALALDPDHVTAHWNRAHARLRLGGWTEGWEDFRWRHKRPGAMEAPPLPEWQGQPMPSATLLVWAEQGLGDAIQFVRFLPWVQQRVGRVIVAVHAALRPLFRASFAGIELADLDLPWPQADVQVALLDLAGLSGARPDALPPAPYLAADPARTADWQDKLHGPGRALGFAWKGNPAHRADARRSFALSDLVPILALPGYRFYSLQIEADHLLPSGIVDLAPALTDFGETAAILVNLDAVITPDTALAHLAGGLGRVGHVVLPMAGDWRWGEAGDRCPWYPSLALHRQERAGVWDSPINRLAAALHNAR
ncbi:MAG: tetratricopeptide repeat protein [Rhodospirillales bacterium]|nr:tetratricopeptide repeat protein [Rhodospirillales bacterium]